MPIKQFVLISFSFVFASLLIPTEIFAQALTVFDVRQSLPLTNKEAPQRDYYINGGIEAGLRAGLIVTVKRRRALYDAYQNKSPGTLMIPVGKLRIILAQKGVSVARLYSVFSRANIPILEFDYIMVGDQLDMTTAKMPLKKKKKNPVKARLRPAHSKEMASKLPDFIKSDDRPVEGPLLQ